MSNMYKELSEYIDISKYGKEIFSGSQSIIIDTNENKNMYLILTKEIEKKEYLTNISHTYGFDIIDTDILSELKDEGYYSFLMSKLDSIESDLFNDYSPLSIAFSEYLKFGSNYILPELMDIDNIINNIWDKRKLIYEESREGLSDLEVELISCFDKEQEDFEFDILESARYSLEVIKKMSDSIDSEILVDLHFDQFKLFNNKIVCIDPVLFN